MSSSKIAIVGAGFAGATVAQRLVEQAGQFHDIVVFDERPHVAGNCYTEIDKTTGVQVHKYGPHIFHTDNSNIWRYVSRFGSFMPYVQRTKAIADGRVYSFPVNLHTINQCYGAKWTPEEARLALEEFTGPYREALKRDPQTFEEMALATVGIVIYKTFLQGYTEKQWGRPASSLPASILKRLPVRFNYNDDAYDHPYQGIPVGGYTSVIENMLDHPRIEVKLGEHFKREDAKHFTHVYSSAPVDRWFYYAAGMLPYRTLDIVHNVHGYPLDAQGCAVMNACDASTPWTRSTEHRHFLPGRIYSGTVISREYSREAGENDTLFYPVRLPECADQLDAYAGLVGREENVTFMGRLGLFQYLNMDETIARSIRIADSNRSWR